MGDFRAFGKPASVQEPVVILSRDETHHLCVVNRARVNDTVIVFNGEGREWKCRLTGTAKVGATLQVEHVLPGLALPFRVSLAQALPKGQGMDGIVRKATEIGARRVLPLSSERSQVHLDEARGERKHDKWVTAAVEAAKQCGNPWVPEIEPLVSLSTFLEEAPSRFDLRLVASLHPGARRLDQVLASRSTAPREAVWLVGPEGDLSPAEVERAVAVGFQPVTLGPLVLRCETAATYALSVLSHEWTARWA
ncbi:MAG: RsmE family RNA methyltransferase [Opitutaceae bacterium]|nr:RsmE family RNA methyltransferase [Opitutaceae bacterium]